MESIYSRSNCASQLTSQQCGQLMEKLARDYLVSAGLIWIASNVRYRRGELDLIMQEDQTIVFVEVRYRKNSHFGGAAASITWRKQQKVIACAARWLFAQGKSFSTTDCRFDVIAITGLQIEWIKNAFY